jgi:sugar/nucleoside kinase (ribokinase family)
MAASDTTGAGDAFDAGFLVTWLAARRAGKTGVAALHRAALAGHRAAARHLAGPRPELALG